MKPFVWQGCTKVYLPACLLLAMVLSGYTALQAQSCPPTVTTAVSTYPNTFYSSQQASLPAGSSSMVIGPATYGSTPINAGDILLIIQMQGAQIDATNTSSYGSGVAGPASGYLNNANLLAGNMEFVVAANSVPVTGGTLNFTTALVNNYQNSAYGTDGQYSYQIIHVPFYYNLTLGATVTAPPWNGTNGGVVVLGATNVLDMNGQTIDASGTGFRGGGGVQFRGGTGSSSDVVALSTDNACASKGEGIAGTPRYVNNGGSLLVNNVEGYPNGSFDLRAPGNAGGGGTDGNPATNTDNSGGGGGGNGGAGGNGGKSYGSNLPVGGAPGAFFSQNSPLRLVMGGGGGAGTSNDGTGTPSGGFASSGAAGGGIVIIFAGTIVGSGTVNVNGANANSSVLNDASGGGGAGGSVLISATSGHSGLTILANGGTGGSNNGGWSGAHGPGGGGGGGVIYSNGTVNAASSVNPGQPGTEVGGTNYGATAGTAGVLNPNASITPPLSCVVLPTEFISVTATNDSERIWISWQVANEIDITRYIVEESSDAVDFSIAGTVNYKPGNSSVGNYSFSDPSKDEDGPVYYRIKALHTDGHYSFSKIVVIKTAAATDAMTMSPDPASSTCTIKWFSAGNAHVDISLFNATGHIVLRRQYQVKAGINAVPLTDLATLPNGLYLVRGDDGTNSKKGKLLILH